MWTSNKIYKHENCRDVAFLVLTCYEEEGGLMVSGFWVNVYFNPSQLIGPDEGPVTIFVKPEQINKWEIYEE